MKFLVLTLFPEMFTGPLSESIIARAQEKNLVTIETKNIRDFGKGKYKQVDDTPYGGGAGMVMRVDILAEALRWAKNELPEAKVVSLTPQGERLTQKKSSEFAEAKTPLILLCGHFEGIDERVREIFVDEEISLGDFVLTGGEIPAMALIDGVTRLLPGVVGNESSTAEESFSPELFGRLEYPQYTRPEEFEGHRVPQVLLSGNHAEIQKWRQQHIAGCTEEELAMIELRREYFSPQKPWKSRLILLRTPLSEDMPFWQQWFNDGEVTQFLRMDGAYTKQDALQALASAQEELMTLSLTVLERLSKTPIGTTELRRIPENAQIAELAICIGDKEYWGKGYGSAVVREMLQIGFELLGLEKIMLTVFQANLRALKMYQQCGFELRGERKKDILKNGEWQDAFYLEILAKKWIEQGKDEATTKQFLDFRGDFAI